ncbi:hypothetical protein E1A91_A01G030400v1 [Gossypium mustelinum]|uniref:Uncharacterized protein isoform X2 n=2 Tax=Gossypium TaxID=3633 RepID=A0ABM3C408_GOSHI|nr:uncharacterized protein LOC121202850 isoform X2 [Gossypium hirsutum]TYJ47988.1 hypothetical protein E1A91_A01G030400v1 [Gossypium mustelinum]
MSNSLSPSVSHSFPPTVSHIRAFPLRATISIPIAVSARTYPSTLHRRFLWIPSPIMSSNTKLAATQPELWQLDDSSDFEKLLSPSGYISICGFGSLLSERSARSTFPNLLNFRVAKLKGFRRVFAHAAPIFFDRGIAKPETKEISSLSVEPCEGETLIVTVFEIQKSEIPAFMERELEFRFLAVLPETLDREPFANPAEIRTFISSTTVDTTSKRFGEMISCRAVYIFDIVCWQLRILVILLTITSWIILSSETERPPSGHIWRQLVQASWKRSLRNR